MPVITAAVDKVEVAGTGVFSGADVIVAIAGFVSAGTND